MPINTKPVITMSSYTFNGSNLMECISYIIHDGVGYAVHSINYQIIDKCTEEYDISDLKTAVVFCNKMRDAVMRTLALPSSHNDELIKRYYETVAVLDEIHPGIFDNLDLDTHKGDHMSMDELFNQCIKKYDKTSAERNQINAVKLALCGVAKDTIDETEKMIDEFISMNLSDQAKYVYLRYVKNSLIKRLSVIASEIKEFFPEDPKTSEEVLQYLNNFINEYNHISVMENISIRFMD